MILKISNTLIFNDILIYLIILKYYTIANFKQKHFVEVT